MENTVLTFSILDKNFKIHQKLKLWARVPIEHDLWPVTSHIYRWTAVDRRENTIKSQKHPIINICDCFSKVIPINVLLQN